MPKTASAALWPQTAVRDALEAARRSYDDVKAAVDEAAGVTGS
jgi:hypothetical protein